MTNPVFPVLIKMHDSKRYSEEMEDPALKTKMEGGYTVSRAKHTRKPRRSFKLGYTGIGPADRTSLVNFYETMRGGSVVFDWRDPIDDQVWQVRFAERLNFKYVGIGPTKLWDVEISLEQA